MNRQFSIYAGISALILVGSIGYTIHNHTRIHILKMGVGDRESAGYEFAQNLSILVSKYAPKIKIDLVVTEGSLKNVELLEKNEIQLATAHADIVNSSSIRLVSYLFSDKYQLIVTEKSRITKVSDLKGKRIALPPGGSGQYQSFQILAEHYGLRQQDFQSKILSEAEADLAFSRNEVDAVFRTRLLSNDRIRRLVQKNRGRLIAIEQGEAMKIEHPALMVATIPKGAYQGNPPIPPTDIPTVGIERNFLARNNVPPEIIRQITQILFEHQAELTDKMPIAAGIKQPSDLSLIGSPIHPGAQAYYDRNKPSFFQENADYLGLLLTLAALVCSWFIALKGRLEKVRKNRADVYNQDIVALIFAIQESEDLTEVIQIHRQLNEIFKTVVYDLDKDKISAESFESFSFAWQAAITSVRDRENLLRNEFRERAFE